MVLKSNMSNDSFLLNMSCYKELVVTSRNPTFIMSFNLKVLTIPVFKSSSLTMAIPDSSPIKGASIGVDLCSLGFNITSIFLERKESIYSGGVYMSLWY